MSKKKKGDCPICQKGNLQILDHTFYQCDNKSCAAQIQMKEGDKNKKSPPKYDDDWEDEDPSYEDDPYYDYEQEDDEY